MDLHVKTSIKYSDVKGKIIFCLFLANFGQILGDLYYLVREQAVNGRWTEKFGEIFLEIANSPFGVYISYLQIYLRMFFNLLRLVPKKVVDNYVGERCSSKKTVSKIRKRLNNTLISCYSETGGKLMKYLNLVLSSMAFEWIFFYF